MNERRDLAFQSIMKRLSAYRNGTGLCLSCGEFAVEFVDVLGNRTSGRNSAAAAAGMHCRACGLDTRDSEGTASQQLETDE